MVVLGYLRFDSHIHVLGRCTLHYRRGPLPPWSPPLSSSPVVPATFPGLSSSRWRRPRRSPSSSFSFPLMPPHPSPSVRSSSLPHFRPRPSVPSFSAVEASSPPPPAIDRPPSLHVLSRAAGALVVTTLARLLDCLPFKIVHSSGKRNTLWFWPSHVVAAWYVRLLLHVASSTNGHCTTSAHTSSSSSSCWPWTPPSLSLSFPLLLASSHVTTHSAFHFAATTVVCGLGRKEGGRD